MIGMLIAIAVLLLAERVRPRAPVRRTPPPRTAGSRPWLVITAGVVTAVTVRQPLAAISAALAAASIRWWRGVRRRRMQLDAIQGAYPELLDLLVLSIRAGSLPASALVDVHGFVDPVLQPALGRVAAQLDAGDRFADALRALSADLGSIAEPLVDSLAAADRYGLPLAPVLERLTAEAREQRRRAAQAAARELPVRLAVPLVLCTLPSYVLLAIVPLLLGALTSLRT